ncbi:MAG: autotransporter-associated beta strand repeat-containing protein [Verrucomicrobia bacterium]|nr:autotransporter-associated beta strand repeat-containing protein [Verrucomicrobiota bacterium]
MSKSGASTLVLAGPNTHTGDTSISGGTLQLGDANAVANSTVSLGVTNGLTFGTGIGTFVLGGLSGAIPLALTDTGAAAVTLEVGNNGQDTTYYAALNGVSGALTKVGSGMLTLAAANGYTGATTVNGGTLVLGVDGGTTYTYAGGAIAINNGATLRVKGMLCWFGGKTVTFDSNGGGTMDAVVQGTGGLAFSANNTFVTSGGTQNSITGTQGGIAGVGGNSNLGFNLGGQTATFDVAPGTSGSSDLTVSATLWNAGSVIKNGDGILTLSGVNNSYTGPTTVNAGTLAVTGALGATAVTVNSPATLAGNGNIGGNVTIASGAHHALAVAATAGAQVTRAITGTLTMTDSILDLTAASTPAAGEYVLATASVAITGTPTTINYNGISGGTVSVDATSSPQRLLLTVGGSSYGIWAATNAPTGGVSDDSDGDGVSNGVEYVLGGDKDHNDLGKLPKTSTDGGDMLFTFERSQVTIDGSTTVVIETSPDLSDWTGSYPVPDAAATNNPGVSVVKGTPTGFDTVTLRLPRAPDARKFARLKVTVP